MKKKCKWLVSLLLLSSFSSYLSAATCPAPNNIKETKLQAGYLFTAEGGWKSGIIKWDGEIKDLFRATFTSDQISQPNKGGKINFCAYHFANTGKTVTLKLPDEKNRAFIKDNAIKANGWYSASKNKVYACHGDGKVENCPFEFIVD